MLHMMWNTSKTKSKIIPQNVPNCTCLVWHDKERCCRSLTSLEDIKDMQNEMKYKLTSPYFSRAIPKLLIHLTKEWGLMNGERPIGLKMAWDAAALLDKAIHLVTEEIYRISQVNDKQTSQMLSTLESHLIPRLTNALQISIKRDSSTILVPASKCVQSLQALGYNLTIHQFNKSERTVLSRLEYRLNWYSVFHCAELLIERLHYEFNRICPNPRFLWSFVEPMIEVYMTNRSKLLKRFTDRNHSFQVDAFFEGAAAIVVASLTATPPLNVQEITLTLASVIAVDTKLLAIYSDIIILFLLE